MIDSGVLEAELAVGRIHCPGYGGPLSPWGYAREREVRLLDCSRRRHCYASEFVSEIGRFVTPSRCVCNDAVRGQTGARRSMSELQDVSRRGGRRKRALSAEEKLQIWLQLLTGELTQRQAADISRLLDCEVVDRLWSSWSSSHVLLLATRSCLAW